MEMIHVIGNVTATYQRQGNDKNGNPIYLINFFESYYNGITGYTNINSLSDCKMDKYGNIRKTSYNIKKDIQSIGLRIYQNINK